MPTMNHVVECVADQYAIPEYVMDIIYMYINRNMIKSCTDEFTNPIFLKQIKRMVKNEYKCMGDRNRFRREVNHGRLMLRLLYPKVIAGGLIRPIQREWSHENKEKLPTINGLRYETYEFRGGLAVRVEVDRLFTNEMHPTMNRYYCEGKRTDMIEVIDYHQESLMRHGIYGEEARVKGWTPKYAKNKKNLYYVHYLIPQVSNYKR